MSPFDQIAHESLDEEPSHLQEQRFSNLQIAVILVSALIFINVVINEWETITGADCEDYVGEMEEECREGKRNSILTVVFNTVACGACIALVIRPEI